MFTSQMHGNYCKTNMSGLQDTQTLQRDADMLRSAG